MSKKYIDKLTTSDIKEIVQKCFREEVGKVEAVGDHITVLTTSGYVIAINDFSVYSLSINLSLLPEGKKTFEQFMAVKFGEEYVDDLLDANYETDSIDNQIKDTEKHLEELREERLRLLREKDKRRLELQVNQVEPVLYTCYNENMKLLGVQSVRRPVDLLTTYPETKYVSIEKEQKKLLWYMIATAANGPAFIKCESGMNNYKAFLDNASYKYTGSTDTSSYDLPPHLRVGSVFQFMGGEGHEEKVKFVGPNINDKTGTYCIKLKDVNTGKLWNARAEWFDDKEIYAVTAN